jgi:hypothetical protein
VFIGSVFEGMLKTSISISRSIFFGLLVFEGLPISSLSYSFFVPCISLLLPVVGLSLSVCSQGLPISSLSYSFFVPCISLLLPVVGLSLSVCSQGLPISSLSYNFFVPRIGLPLPVVGLSLSVCSFLFASFVS